ncbi:hypothetical protein Dsin_032603 [Dipteronia sinensis]|uniref:Reverse transcriptase domain-containing protein n=1 Tax=Dipteronia sinensis TaxID=43782 RepID=A0AAD9ZC54_9ROSI|nr:hypothetical protein Dsin_032603 [Dipteronia sinensis]
MGFIKGEVFGNIGVQVTHLQFVDDTVIFLKPRVDYLLNLKRIIRCFELSSKLKINFHKSYVIRVGKNVTNENSWAYIFRCRKATLPITYLGLPLGGRPYSKVFWNPVVDKIETRLRPWKRKFLSKSGRLVLIKSMLCSIPTYYLSVFKKPVAVAQRIEKLQRSFF